MSFPATVGEAVDHLYSIRAERQALDKKSKEVKEQEAALKAYIIQLLQNQDLDGAKGKVATASITRSEQPIVEDWDLVHQYIIDNDAWEVTQRRVSVTALRERWGRGETIPGIKSYMEVDLSLTKAGGK